MKLKTVLIVEDEKDIQMLSEMTLRDIGKLNVRTADNGKEALEVLQEWKPDLILMDVMMPHLTGPETMIKLSKDPNLKNIPVVFMTAKSEDKAEAEYLKLGVIEVLIKPFDPMTLSLELEAIYKNYQKESQL